MRMAFLGSDPWPGQLLRRAPTLPGTLPGNLAEQGEPLPFADGAVRQSADAPCPAPAEAKSWPARTRITPCPPSDAAIPWRGSDPGGKEEDDDDDDDEEDGEDEDDDDDEWEDDEEFDEDEDEDDDEEDEAEDLDEDETDDAG